jgi:uncharacterized membrane protein (DUF485 family)
MSTADVPAAMPADLKDRVVKILTQPKTEWEVIEAETTSTSSLYREYIAILAAIPALANFVGLSLVGITVPILGTIRIGVVRGLANAVVSYVLALVGVYVAAVVIEKLAPSFESRPDRLQALKLVAYASTPVWLAGILAIIPALAVLIILIGLYSIYLFYLGVPVLMKTPMAKVVPYMIVAAIVTIVISFVMGTVAGSVTGVRTATGM